MGLMNSCSCTLYYISDHIAYQIMYTLLLFILIGVTLRLRGNSIPTDGSGRIVITDINTAGHNALICLSEMAVSSNGDWFLHPTQQTTQHTEDGSVRIESTDPRGWHRDRATNTISVDEAGRLVRLRRDNSAASGGRSLEGVFTCDIEGDTNTPVSVGIYYPSESHVECHLIMRLLLSRLYIIISSLLVLHTCD